jgi:hypothetical protein
MGRGKHRHSEFAFASGEMKQLQFRRFLASTLSNGVDVSLPGALHVVCMDYPKPPRHASSTPQRRRSPNGSNASARKVSTDCATVPHLSALEPAEPVRRYEREHPGELIHIDIKKLGKFNRIGHGIPVTGLVKATRVGSAGSSSTSASTMLPGSPSAG